MKVQTTQLVILKDIIPKVTSMVMFWLHLKINKQEDQHPNKTIQHRHQQLLALLLDRWLQLHPHPSSRLTEHHHPNQLRLTDLVPRPDQPLDPPDPSSLTQERKHLLDTESSPNPHRHPLDRAIVHRKVNKHRDSLHLRYTGLFNLKLPQLRIPAATAVRKVLTQSSLSPSQGGHRTQGRNHRPDPQLVTPHQGNSSTVQVRDRQRDIQPTVPIMQPEFNTMKIIENIACT